MRQKTILKGTRLRTIRLLANSGAGHQIRRANIKQLRDVLHNSINAEHRALAADMLAYTKNKQAWSLILLQQSKTR